MENIEIFVSDHCPHCKKVIDDFNNHPEKYEGAELVDINESMYTLKRFLRYRDKLEEFKQVKEDGKVGVPSKVIDTSKVSFDF